MTAPSRPRKKVLTDPGCGFDATIMWQPDSPEEQQAALAYLRRHDALDLAEMLGLEEQS